jgi:hypothetical protein
MFATFLAKACGECFAPGFLDIVDVPTLHMELLLNLVWLTLALPAIWIWRHGPARVKCSRGYSRLGSSLLLMCVLMLLFPVVSASDDLHPMRAEMEESSPIKRTVKQLSNNASATWLFNPGVFFARSISDSQISPSNEAFAPISPTPLIFPELFTYGQRDSRGPPSLIG